MNEEIKQRIIEFNNRFGIKTEFIRDESILGYALGRTIYINESIDQDYEKTNKHELLHFFENTPEFEKIKTRLLEEHKDELEEIRKDYELRYFGIYSEEEIAKGVLDNEIAIDMMVNNLSFEYDKGLKIGEEFLGEIEKGLEEKRYLNLSIDANLRNTKELSRWEKIFVQNYYDGKKRKKPQGNWKERGEKIRADIEAYLKKLCELQETEMQIDPTSEEVKREYDNDIKALKAKGEYDPNLESETEKEKKCKKIAERISKQLYAEYRQIVDVIKKSEIDDPAFKCMMLRETLKKVYRKIDEDKKSKDAVTIVKSRDLHKTIASHMILNEEILKYIYEISKKIENIENVQNVENAESTANTANTKIEVNLEDIEGLEELLKNSNFADIYFKVIETYKRKVAGSRGIDLKGVDTYGKGKWIKFKSKETEEREAEEKGTKKEDYLEGAKKLAALVQDTPWCTKQFASLQLAEGDFYVFVDNEGKPHIAVRMEGEEIAEVRGIKNGDAQEMEEEYEEVAISFLENNRNANGKEWLEREKWNKSLIEYKKKIDDGKITLEDIPNLIEYCFKKDFTTHEGGENSNKKQLKESLKKIKGLIAEYYQCTEEEICIGDANLAKLTKNPYVAIFGKADFLLSEITDLEKLQMIGGDAIFFGKVRDLGNLKSIGGSASFHGSKITSLGNLQSIGADGDFSDSQVTNLGNLQSIGRDAKFRNSQITDLGNLQSIGRDAYFTDSKVTSLGNLQSIGERATFGNAQITNLGNLQIIGRDSDLGDLIEVRKKFDELGKRDLTGQAIGMAGLESSVEMCDEVDKNMKGQSKDTTKGNEEVTDE